MKTKPFEKLKILAHFTEKKNDLKQKRILNHQIITKV